MVTDDQIRGAVIALFKKYDKDNSGYIDQAEVPKMCTDLAQELQFKKNYTQQQILDVLKSMDHNQDGKVSRD